MLFCGKPRIFFLFGWFACAALIFLSAGSAIAGKKADSLLAAADKEMDPVRKAELYRDAAVAIKDTLPENALALLQKALTTSINAKNSAVAGAICNNIAVVNAEHGQSAIARRYADSALRFLEFTKDNRQKSLSYNILGGCFLAEGDFERSSEMFFSALNYLDSTSAKNDGRLNIYNNLAYLLNEMHQYSTSLFYSLKEYKLARELNLNDEVAYACSNVTEAYLRQRNAEGIEPYLKELDSLARISGDDDLKTLAAMKTAQVAMIKNQFEKAAALYQEIADKKRNSPDNDFRCEILNDLAGAYQMMKEYKKAEKIMFEALAISLQTGSGKERCTTYSLLRDNFDAQKNYKQAYRYSLAYQLLQDSLVNERSQKTLLNLETKYKTKEQEALIDLLSKDNKIKQYVSERQKFIMNAIIALVVLLATVFVLLFNRYKLRKQLENKEALIRERMRISSELHDDIGATLGSISVYSQVAKNKLNKNADPEEALTKIGTSSRDLLDKMSDIVWSLKEGHITGEQMQQRMETFAAMILDPAQVQLSVVGVNALAHLRMSPAKGKAVFLIFKEAMHNIAKYAMCKNVTVSVSESDGSITMLIKDNGIGFQPNHAAPGYSGNGIKNMQTRAAEINAILNIASSPGKGTSVTLRFNA